MTHVVVSAAASATVTVAELPEHAPALVAVSALPTRAPVN